MKRYDPEQFTPKKLLGITSVNFVPIYSPIFASIVVFGLGVAIFLVTNNTKLFKIMFGLSGLIFALSGIGQMRLKEVPGFPSLHGGCAVIFGILFLLFFMYVGVAVIFLE